MHSQLEQLTNAGGSTTGWRYTTSEGEVELYSAAGTLQFITDRHSNTKTLTYDTQNRLDRVDTNTGEYLIFGYDTSNRISTLTDHANRVWAYRYDAAGNLEYVDNPDSTSKRYHYEDTRFPHALTGITDERGIRYATYGYDDQGRANLSTHAGNAQRVDIVYNADGTRTVTNSRNQPSTYNTAVQLGVALVTNIAGPGCSTCGTGNTSYTYDPANNNLLSKTENGVTTQYGNYDSKGQYGYKIEAVGTPQERRTDYTYDARFYHKITTLTEPSVAVGQQKVTTTAYDDWGNRLSETVNGFRPDGTPVSRTTTWQYTGPLHQLSQVDGPRTDVADITTYAYYPDDANQGANRARLRRVTDATGVALRDAIQYTATGKVLSESRPNGLTLGYTYYPGNDRLQTLTEPTGSTSRVTRWTYLATGEVETVTQADGSADATTLTFGYDDARRLTRLTDGLGNYIEYTLNTEGNRTFEKTYDSAG
ncbi:MAG: RHS repeat protein, partial [Anaerolineae bacterium]|nr:RHS repeat protein [Anaerolineae bacterium]